MYYALCTYTSNFHAVWGLLKLVQIKWQLIWTVDIDRGLRWQEVEEEEVWGESKWRVLVPVAFINVE